MAFLKSENVLSPGGRLRKQLPRGPFDGVFFKLFGLGNEYWTFFPYGDMAFLKSENVLFAGGVGWGGMDGVSKVSFKFLYTF